VSRDCFPGLRRYGKRGSWIPAGAGMAYNPYKLPLSDFEGVKI